MDLLGIGSPGMTVAFIALLLFFGAVCAVFVTNLWGLHRLRKSRFSTQVDDVIARTPAGSRLPSVLTSAATDIRWASTRRGEVETESLIRMLREQIRALEEENDYLRHEPNALARRRWPDKETIGQ